MLSELKHFPKILCLFIFALWGFPIGESITQEISQNGIIVPLTMEY